MLSHQFATNIRQHDQVVIYPTFGHLARSGRVWRIPITGMVYEGGDACRRKRLWLELLQRLNKFHPNDEQRELFEKRVRAFVARTQRGKQVALCAGNEVYPLKRKTKGNGLLTSTLQLPVAAAMESERRGQLQNGWLYLDVVRPDGERSGFRGAVRLLDHAGFSVISDIDDTVKVTNVTCRHSLLENTFLREFSVVTGMAEVYRRWATQGAAFHYVSSSPWQLFAPLSEFFERARLPAGSFHLRSFGLRDHMLRRLWMLRKRAKISVLTTLLQSFPRRHFVLLGDSGERDPEIYGAVARSYGNQITCTYIRELPQHPMTTERCENAFQGVDGNRWKVFRDAAELPRSLGH